MPTDGNSIYLTQNMKQNLISFSNENSIILAIITLIFIFPNLVLYNKYMKYKWL